MCTPKAHTVTHHYQLITRSALPIRGTTFLAISPNSVVAVAVGYVGKVRFWETLGSAALTHKHTLVLGLTKDSGFYGDSLVIGDVIAGTFPCQ